MNHFNANTGEIAAELAVLAMLGAAALRLVLRKRPTAEEMERARRQFLAHSGRLVDGMLLDMLEIVVSAKTPAKGELDRTLTMLLYSYHIGGVDYECSQDITALREIVDLSEVRAGFPCSARYQPGNPTNSIVVSEEWSGLRMGLPVLPAYDDPEPVDLSHLRPGAGESGD
jgi:hypothetical protein